MQIDVTDRDGTSRTIEGKPGYTLMETLRDAGFDEIIALCGGCCSCATCHVHVTSHDLTRLSPISADEESLLDTSPSRDDRSRLSCQILLTEDLDGLKVAIAQED